MDIWDILEIEYTTDEKEIRDAYAECAKKVHPEEHPEEFKRLQAAYKQAIKHAKSVGKLPTEGIEIIEIEDDFFYFVPFDEYLRETEDTGNEEVSEEVSDVYDYSVIQVDEEEHAELRKEFFWRFKHLYKYSYTQNSVEAWKILMEDPNYKPLFELSDFLSELSVLIGDMQYICSDVWKYMIERFERYSYITRCEAYIEYIQEKMSLNSVRNRRKKLSFPSESEEIIAEEILHMGQKEGKRKTAILQMDYFVPHLFYVLHRQEKGINPEVSKRMSDRSPFRRDVLPTSSNKLALLFCIIVIVFWLVILAVSGDGKKNTETKSRQERNMESIKESIQEDLRNNYQNNSIFESIGESLMDKQNR